MGKKVTNEKLAQMLQKEFLAINKRFDDFDKKMEKGFKESEMRDQGLDRILRAETERHDRHSVLIVDHEKRIKELEKV